ncbi:MAG: hypothetical protein IK000_09510 [Bacteroidaceae bacterium]|nr:hypothetical protein [Bacteroidaceae bacterium]
MTRQTIISAIKGLQKEYSGSKDGGRSFVVALAKKVGNACDDERETIVAFLLDEVGHNANGMCSLALSTIENLRSPDLSSQLEQVYTEQQATKDARWKRDVLMVLLKRLHPSEAYDEYLADNPANGDSFHFLVHYANLYPQKGIPLLADCLIKDIHIGSLLPSENPDTFIGVTPYLLCLVNPPRELLTPLVETVCAKDARSGNHLRQFMVHLLRNYPHTLPNDFVEGILSDLERAE